MNLKLSLSLGKLSHELLLTAGVVLIDIEEVMDSLAIFLVKFSTESGENSFQFSNIYIFIVVDITTSEELLVGDISILQDLKELEHSFVLETDVVVTSVCGVMLFSRAVISFKGVVIFVQSNISLHVFIKDQN